MFELAIFKRWFIKSHRSKMIIFFESILVNTLIRSLYNDISFDTLRFQLDNR